MSGNYLGEAFLKALPVCFHLRIPSFRDLTGGLGVESWLWDLVQGYAELDSLYFRTAAVGLLGRLWVPCSRDTARIARQRSLSGHGPGQDGRRWWADMSADPKGPVVQHAIVRDALLHVDDLSDALDRLAKDPDMDTLSTLRALSLLHERDDLQSVAFLAGSTHPALLEALVDIDACTVAQRLLDIVPVDERLQAVGRRDIDVWWGQAWVR